MTIVPEPEWPRLDLFTYNGIRVSLAANQHLLGWLIIFPASEVENSLVHLPENELLDFKKVGLLCEKLLSETFNAEWFNYLQEGNGVKRIHIHLHPRYSFSTDFAGFKFTDEGFGRKVKFLQPNDLPPKDVVFNVVSHLRDKLKTMDIGDLNIQICSE